MNHEKLIDMHTHTSYSDGVLTPQELIALAIDSNIGTIAITDHDTVNGLNNINKSDPRIIRSGIRIIDGIELSAMCDSGTMHILGYGIDKENEKLNKRLDEIRTINLYSVLAIITQIKKDFQIQFNYNDMKDLINSNHNLGRPDIAKLCIKYGYASSVNDAFKKYLISAKDKTKEFSKGIKFQECIDLILDSGGIAILAHPKSLNLNNNDFLVLLRNMIKCGLKGIEVYHSTHTESDIKYYLEVANHYGLLISGGSDFHGKTVKPDIKLGTGKNNNLKIKKLSLLDKLH